MILGAAPPNLNFLTAHDVAARLARAGVCGGHRDRHLRRVRLAAGLARRSRRCDRGAEAARAKRVGCARRLVAGRAGRRAVVAGRRAAGRLGLAAAELRSAGRRRSRIRGRSARRPRGATAAESLRRAGRDAGVHAGARAKGGSAPRRAGEHQRRRSAKRRRLFVRPQAGSGRRVAGRLHQRHAAVRARCRRTTSRRWASRSSQGALSRRRMAATR